MRNQPTPPPRSCVNPRLKTSYGFGTKRAIDCTDCGRPYVEPVSSPAPPHRKDTVIERRPLPCRTDFPSAPPAPPPKKHFAVDAAGIPQPGTPHPVSALPEYRQRMGHAKTNSDRWQTLQFETPIPIIIGAGPFTAHEVSVLISQTATLLRRRHDKLHADTVRRWQFWLVLSWLAFLAILASLSGR